MALTLSPRQELLVRVWGLQPKRDYPELIAQLGGLPADDLVEEPELGYLLASSWYWTGDWNRALALIRRVLAEWRGPNDWLRRRCLNTLGLTLVHRGDTTEAEPVLREAVDAAYQAGDEQVVAWATNNLGVVHYHRCEWVEAASHFQRALAAFQRLGDRREVVKCYYNLSQVHWATRRIREAESYCEQAFRFAPDVLSDLDAAIFGVGRALIQRSKGDLHMAEFTARRVLQRVESLGTATLMEGSVLNVLARIVIDAGRYPEARALAGDALERVRRGQSQLEEAEVFETMVLLERAEHRFDAAAAAVEEACRLYEEAGVPARAAQLRAQVAP